MKTKKKPFRSNQAKRDALNKIREVMTLKGYKIYTPIKRLRRNPHDFLAIWNMRCYLFQIGREGIEVRPYIRKTIIYSILPLVRSVIEVHLRLGRTLPAFEGDWKIIIDPTQHGVFDQNR